MTSEQFQMGSFQGGNETTYFHLALLVTKMSKLCLTVSKSSA